MPRRSHLLVLAVILLGMTRGTDAAFIVYTATLNGPSESPPNASPGSGFAEVDFDTTANTLRVRVTFSGLLGTTTASHIHAGTATPFAGTAIVATTTPTFAGFPLGVTSGSYDSGLDLTSMASYNPAFIIANGGTTAGAEAALLASAAAGTSYLNIHTSVDPGGEIRGFLVLAAVPEPASLLLASMGLAGLGGYAWCRRRGAHPATT